MDIATAEVVEEDLGCDLSVVAQPLMGMESIFTRDLFRVAVLVWQFYVVAWRDSRSSSRRWASGTGLYIIISSTIGMASFELFIAFMSMAKGSVVLGGPEALTL